MSGKLKDYQVLDVLSGGTFYKVRHKVTNNIFAWKAYDCSAYSDEQIKNIVNDVKTVSKLCSGALLRYYDTILHAPSRTLYIVLEHNRWRSAQELIALCKATDKHIAETFLWYLLLELARVCKLIQHSNLFVLQKCIKPSSIFIQENCELRVNCFELTTPKIMEQVDAMRQVGDVMHSMCYRLVASDDKPTQFHYSDDLRNVLCFLTENRNANLSPDVILYHPTVLTNCETTPGHQHLNEVLVSVQYSHTISEMNKCDSEKAVELCKSIEPAPRTKFDIPDSPIYINVTPKTKANRSIEESNSSRVSLSPTLAALALELPGFVPRSRKPVTDALIAYNRPHHISEETLSQQWMSRLIALRQREESLNQREREIIAKEIINSPSSKIIPMNVSQNEVQCESESNGITLPAVITQAKDERNEWVTRRRHRRAASLRTKGRRKTFAYEDLDSSLSADAGDGSIIVTATKFTKENMPRRNIFPEVSTKKVHFTSTNPFAESDDSVTLTFYELDDVDSDGYQLPKRKQRPLKDIKMFKYLDLEKVTSEKRSSIQQWSTSPSKQAKLSNKIFTDITNTNRENIKKTPSKTSLMSKGSSSSRYSISSIKSNFSMESKMNIECEGSVSERTRSRQCLAQTPVAPLDVKKNKRKSLLPFRTPFKFMTAKN